MTAQRYIGLTRAAGILIARRSPLESHLVDGHSVHSWRHGDRILDEVIQRSTGIGTFTYLRDRDTGEFLGAWRLVGSGRVCRYNRVEGVYYARDTSQPVGFWRLLLAILVEA